MKKLIIISGLFLVSFATFATVLYKKNIDCCTQQECCDKQEDCCDEQQECCITQQECCTK